MTKTSKCRDYFNKLLEQEIQLIEERKQKNLKKHIKNQLPSEEYGTTNKLKDYALSVHKRNLSDSFTNISKCFSRKTTMRTSDVIQDTSVEVQCMVKIDQIKSFLHETNMDTAQYGKITNLINQLHTTINSLVQKASDKSIQQKINLIDLEHSVIVKKQCQEQSPYWDFSIMDEFVEQPSKKVESEKLLRSKNFK